MARWSRWLLLTVALVASAPAAAAQRPVAPRWSAARTWAWQRQHGWQAGANYIPRTAINQLEMWQAETFDPATIDQELGWAQQIGFNSARVFLHDLLWQQDSIGFMRRIDQFLTIAARHRIGVMFVLLDGVWNPEPHLGTQPAPVPHRHNSGWVQGPGAAILRDSSRYDELRPYVKGILTHYRNDRRIVAWDLFNEPDNADRILDDKIKPVVSLALLQRVTRWAREVNPSQPLTVGVWWGDWDDSTKWAPIQRFSLENSDIISFHQYGDSAAMRKSIRQLTPLGRPMFCTEYMARHQQSTFPAVMPVLAELNVNAINWGFVSGKTNTIFPWDSATKPYPDDPTPWFHDIFRPNGQPYDAAETAVIRRLTREKHPRR